MNRSQAEKQMLAVTEKAKKQIHDEYDEVDPVLDIIPSWSGRDLYLDVKFESVGWKRMIHVLEDDSEVSAFGRLK